MDGAEGGKKRLSQRGSTNCGSWGSAEPIPTARLDTHSCTASRGPPRSKCGSSWRRTWSSTNPGEGEGSEWGKEVSIRAMTLPRSQLLSFSCLPPSQCPPTRLTSGKIETASTLPAPSSGPGVSGFLVTPPLSETPPPSTQKQLALAHQEMEGWHFNHTQKDAFLIVGD